MSGPTGGAAGESRKGSPMGGRVRAARERLGWNREALAYHSGLSWSAIEQIESGRRRNTRPDTLTALSRALGVTIDYLVSGESPLPMLSHQVLVYGDDDGFLDAAVPFLCDGIGRSEALLAVTKANNIGILKERMGRDADQVEFVDAEAWYDSPVSALNGYRAFLADRLAKGAPWARIVGDPGWSGGSEAEIRAWNQYESFVNMAFGPSPVTVLCTYDERSVHPTIVTTARLTHPWVVEGSETTKNPTYREPGEFVLGSPAP